MYRQVQRAAQQPDGLLRVPTGQKTRGGLTSITESRPPQPPEARRPLRVHHRMPLGTTCRRQAVETADLATLHQEEFLYSGHPLLPHRAAPAEAAGSGVFLQIMETFFDGTLRSQALLAHPDKIVNAIARAAEAAPQL